MSQQETIEITSEGAYAVTTTRTLIETAGHLQRSIDEFDAVTESNPTILLDERTYKNRPYLKFRERESVLLCTRRSSFNIHGLWTPDSTGDFLLYRPTTRDHEYNIRQNSDSLVFTKSIPLNYWLVFSFQLDRSRNCPEISSKTESLTCYRSTPTVWMLTNAAMNGIELEGNAGETFRTLPDIPNLYGDGRCCTGGLDTEWNSDLPWHLNFQALIEEWDSKPTNADLDRCTNGYWRCDSNLELVVDMESLFHNSIPSSNSITNSIGAHL